MDLERRGKGQLDGRVGHDSLDFAPHFVFGNSDEFDGDVGFVVGYG